MTSQLAAFLEDRHASKEELVSLIFAKSQMRRSRHPAHAYFAEACAIVKQHSQTKKVRMCSLQKQPRGAL
jgi:hypothetical protein